MSLILDQIRIFLSFLLLYFASLFLRTEYSYKDFCLLNLFSIYIILACLHSQLGFYTVLKHCSKRCIQKVTILQSKIYLPGSHLLLVCVTMSLPLNKFWRNSSMLSDSGKRQETPDITISPSYFIQSGLTKLSPFRELCWLSMVPVDLSLSAAVL